MIRLLAKHKREAEAAAAAAAAAAAGSSSASTASGSTLSFHSCPASPGANQQTYISPAAAPAVAGDATVTADHPPTFRMTSAHIRVQKDLCEVALGINMRLEPVSPTDFFAYSLYISPDCGPYFGGTFCFLITFPEGYPHDPPRVNCTQRVFHPNIDYDGRVCLNILRQDWRPVLSLNAVVFGLNLILLEPTALDPLNKEAASILRSSPTGFANAVARTMRGGVLDGLRYDEILSR